MDGWLREVAAEDWQRYYAGAAVTRLAMWKALTTKQDVGAWSLEERAPCCAGRGTVRLEYYICTGARLRLMLGDGQGQKVKQDPQQGEAVAIQRLAPGGVRQTRLESGCVPGRTVATVADQAGRM